MCSNVESVEHGYADMGGAGPGGAWRPHNLSGDRLVTSHLCAMQGYAGERRPSTASVASFAPPGYNPNEEHVEVAPPP